MPGPRTLASRQSSRIRIADVATGRISTVHESHTVLFEQRPLRLRGIPRRIARMTPIARRKATGVISAAVPAVLASRNERHE